MSPETIRALRRVELGLIAAKHRADRILYPDTKIVWLFKEPQLGHSPATLAAPTAQEITMSDLSKLLNAIGSAFEKAVGAAPAESQPGLQNAASTVQSAASQVETVFPALVEGAVNSVMNLFPVAAPFEAVTDMFITEVITALEAKKSTASKTSAPPPVAG